ncbi:hypothetical protein [Ruania alba]|uniref:Uncharacterized protein n=1 Tax=Ruania alba TaxID=648782 RepID=A0A1H5MPF5_9MICO|nr:hypothetical protein [Ruania alba]SEE91020.1 hypothetical protein SAMN04488554_3527 [Ruania alba]
MSTVPPHDREERDPNAAPDDNAAADATPPAENGENATAAEDVDAARPADDSAPAADEPLGASESPESSAGAAPDEPASASNDGPAEPEPPTRQLPTEADDAALREERARRFGRGTSTPDEETPVTQPSTAEADATDTRVEPVPAPMETQPEDPFSDWDDGPQSRAAAHWWGILIAIVFAPIAWYLLTDGGERVSFSLDRSLEAVNVAGLLELAGGLLCTVVLLLAARWSSLGPIIVGSIGTLIGGAFLAVPVIVSEFLASQSAIFDRLGQFGTNLYDHLVAEGHAGRLLLYGIVLIFIGVVSHGARRQGRREERRRIAAES